MTLRDQLAKKRAHTTTETFPIGEAGEKAATRLEAADQQLKMLAIFEAKGQAVDKTAIEGERKKAIAEYKKNSLTLTFRGLSPNEYDAMQDQYAVPEDSKEKVDLRGYTGELMAATVVDSDMTADEWIVELYDSGKWSEGEVRKLRHAAQDAYAETSGPAIPKD